MGLKQATSDPRPCVACREFGQAIIDILVKWDGGSVFAKASCFCRLFINIKY